MEQIPGRNDACPCGSGKKFKKCHGAASGYVSPEPENHLDISREIAYRGAVGRDRREFCEQFIAAKQLIFRQMTERQAEMAAGKGEAVTCREGCVFCCMQYVDVSLQEAEAIVYHLYHNENKLQNFLKRYPVWREQVRAAGDSFNRIIRHWDKTSEGWRVKKSVEGGLSSLYEFTVANVPCPFLEQSACSIYEVRPYVCAGAFATTPAELCQPLNRSRAKIYTSLEPGIVDDVSFYHNELAQPVQSLMPLTVFQLLNDGLVGLPEIPGLENLPREFMNDPEVKPAIETYLKKQTR